VHLVTADPAEAEDYLSAAPDQFDDVAMPTALADLISIFIDSHAEDDESLGNLPPKRNGITLH
jgi:hypothetical protein